MTENVLRYNYDITFKERYYITKKDAFTILSEEQKNAQDKNHALILTGKGYNNMSYFDAFSAEKLTHNFTWIHFCPQEVLNFDDEESQEGYYYISVMEGIAKKIML